jgi:hypothetical protein
VEPTPPESETLNWYTPEQRTPPVRCCLFVRLERKTDGRINFATSLWDPERGFLYHRLEDIALSGSGLFPSFYGVTHWALSERANEVKTDYAWLPPEQPDIPPTPLPL